MLVHAHTLSVAALSVLSILAPPTSGSVERVRQHVAFLTAAEPVAGSDGERRAAAYLAAQLEELGAVSLTGTAGYFQEFAWTPETDDGSQPASADAKSRERRTGRNVIGLLPPEGEGGPPAGWRPAVVLGARYHGPGGDPSGVATVLEAGELLAGQKRRAPVVLAFWSGLEPGRFGPSRFLEILGESTGRIAAYLDLAQVGRIRDNRLDLHGVGSSPVWPRLIEETNVVVGFDVRVHTESLPAPDASVFYAAGVPIVSLAAAAPAGQPRTGGETGADGYADLDKAARFAAIFAGKIGRLERPPEHAQVDRGAAASGERRGARAYTGTIPDYAAGVVGLRLNGVIGGGPAERAGLRKGDVIIEISGRSISDVHDYSEALDALEIGRPVRVVCLRDGEQLEFTVTPTARP